MTFAAETEWDQNICVLRIVGEVDILVVPLLRLHLIEIVDQGAQHIVIDLDQVTFIDSSGLGTLTLARKKHLSTVLAFDLEAPVVRVLDLVGLSSVFDTYRSVEEAKQTLREETSQ